MKAAVALYKQALEALQSRVDGTDDQCERKVLLNEVFVFGVCFVVASPYTLSIFHGQPCVVV